MRRYGRYAQLHPGTNLRIIALNSFVQDALNSYTWINMTDPMGELRWLEETLRGCEIRGEHALIIGHFAPYTPSGAIEWNQRYLVLVDRYANIIRGQLFGHTHRDSFEIIRSARGNGGELSGVALEHPSLTTNFALHPSYRVYEMDPRSHTLLDFEQYRMNLTDANRFGLPSWKLSYRFTQYYCVKNMEDRAFLWLAERIHVSNCTSIR